MKSFLRLSVIGLSAALLACGGSSGKKSPSGSEAGVMNADSDAVKDDAGTANADLAGAQADAAQDAAACSSFTPCGGDIVGTWYFRSECLPNVSSPFCANYTISLELPDTTTTYTFTADGTISVVASGPLHVVEPYPIACLSSDASPPQACSALQETIRQWLPGHQDAGSSTLAPTDVTCSTESDQLCTCISKYEVPQTVTTGTYTTSGNRIISTLGNPNPLSNGQGVDGGTSGTMDYCVSGNTLRLGWTASSRGYVATLTK